MQCDFEAKIFEQIVVAFVISQPGFYAPSNGIDLIRDWIA